MVNWSQAVCRGKKAKTIVRVYMSKMKKEGGKINGIEAREFASKRG